jgi:type I restriction enzyme S subunit
MKLDNEATQNERYELPPGWAWTTISDIVQPVSQFNPAATPQTVYRYVDVSSISNRRFEIDAPKVLTGAEAPTRARQAIRPGDVLFSTVRPYLRNIALVRSENEGNVGSTAFCVLRSNGCVEPGYLFRWTLTKMFSEDLFPKQRGISYPAVRDADVLEQVIPLAPLPEQRKIVAKIEALFEQSRTARQALDRIPPLLKKFRQSILASAFRGDLTRDWREQHPAIEPASGLFERIRSARVRHYQEGAKKAKGRGRGLQKRLPDLYLRDLDSSRLRELPQSWAWATVEMLASPEPRSIQSGPFGSNLLHSEFQETGVLAIGIDNVLDGRFTSGTQHRISRDKYEQLKKYAARPLDVLITVMATVGRCCVVPEDVETAIITKHVYRISVNRALCEPKYLMNALRSCLAVQEQLYGEIQGVTRPGINGKILKGLLIPVPPIEEQHLALSRIESLFREADEIDAAVAAAQRLCDSLEKSILARAFRGELVPQDLNDAPTSVLFSPTRTEAKKGHAIRGHATKRQS